MIDEYWFNKIFYITNQLIINDMVWNGGDK